MLKSMMLGNKALLNCEKIGFLVSRRVPPEAVMRCLDWATRMRDEGVCVMSGFQSPLEKEVLNILLKGTSPLILVLARRMWDERHIPALFRKPLADGRLLVVSPVSQSIRRPTQPLHPRPRRQALPRRTRSIRTRRGRLGHPAQADQGRYRPCQVPQAHPKTLVAPTGRNCTPSICVPEAGA